MFSVKYPRALALPCANPAAGGDRPCSLRPTFLSFQLTRPSGGASRAGRMHITGIMPALPAVAAPQPPPGNLRVLLVCENLGTLGLTQVPQIPDCIRGTIHLPGCVIPVVDLRLRLGLPETADLANACLIVVQDETPGRTSAMMGVMVDAVAEAVTRPAPTATASPAPSADARPALARLFAGRN